MTRMHSQSGAALFYIMIAVVLIAGLSMIMSRGGRQSTETMNADQARIAAQDIIDYSNSITQTFQKMRLRGVRETEFDVSNPVYKLYSGALASSANSSCTNDTCKVFHVGGGAMQARYAPDNAWGNNSGAGGSTSGMGAFRVLAIQGVGTTEPDLIFDMTYLNKETCVAINKILNVPDPTTLPSDTYAMVNYSGNITTFPAPGAGGPLGDTATELAGRTAFCVQAKPDEYYMFYQVVLAR